MIVLLIIKCLKINSDFVSDMSHHYRINGSMIQQFAGKPVSIIGTVSKVRNEI